MLNSNLQTVPYMDVNPTAAWHVHQAPACDIMSIEVQWFFFNEAYGQSRWVKMADETIIARMEEAVKNNETHIAYDWVEDGKHYSHYVVDLKNMMQYNVTLKTARSILRVAGIPPPFDDAPFEPIVNNSAL